MDETNEQHKAGVTEEDVSTPVTPGPDTPDEVASTQPSASPEAVDGFAEEDEGVTEAADEVPPEASQQEDQTALPAQSREPQPDQGPPQVDEDVVAELDVSDWAQPGNAGGFAEEYRDGSDITGVWGPVRDKAFDDARRKQLRMLPHPPEVEGLEFAVVYQPCDTVGGDFYDFIKLKDGRLGIVQGDVSGHGLEVWGDMAMAMKTLRIHARNAATARDALIHANEDLVPDLEAKAFVSGFFSILDLNSFKLNFARAGHNPMILFNPGRKPKALVEYEPQGMVMGMARGERFSDGIEELEVQLYSGDMLLWHTDGVIESTSPEGEEYGADRLRAVVEIHGREDAENMLREVLEDVHSFRGGARADDDVTMVALRVV